MAPRHQSGLELLAGWRHLTVAFDDDTPMADEHVDAFDSFIAGVLGAHRYRLYRGHARLIVGVGPPAVEAMARLNRAFETELKAVPGPFDGDPGDNLN